MGICLKHASQHNEESRSRLDHIMRELPENQAGTGRHKCPYCAYQQGYRQALSDVCDRLKGMDSGSSD